MSKSRKSLTILSCAIAPVLYGASAMAQDVVTPTQYLDGNPVLLPGFWPNSTQSMTQGASATGTDPVLASNYFNGMFNNNANGAPNNGGNGMVTAGQATSTGSGGISISAIGSGQAGLIIGQTFKPLSNFKLGGLSVILSNGADAGFESNGVSLHLFQLDSTINGGSGGYTPSNNEVGGDLLGGGQGAVWTPSASSNIEQFVFTGADQVTLQANTEYAFEFFVDGPDSGDTLGFMRTNGNDTNAQPYAGGQAYQVLTGAAGSNATNYYANSAVQRAANLSASARELLFALYAAPPVVTAGTWLGNGTPNTDWSQSGNWVSGSIPGQTAGDSALFGTQVNNNATSQTVDMNGNQTLGTITFNNAGSLYTIAQGTGSGTLTLKAATGTAHIDDLIGHSQTGTGGMVGHTISTPIALSNGLQIAVGQAADSLVLSGNISGAGGITLNGDTNSQMIGTVVLSGKNTYTGGTTIDSGTLLIEPTSPGSATASALATGAVTIGSTSAAADVVLGSNVTQPSLPLTTPQTSNVNITSLAITSNSTLDIGNNHIILDYTPGNDPISSIVAWVDSGANVTAGVPTWTGVGITSSSAAANAGSYGIGYADAVDPGNPAGLATGQIEVMYTLLGDANLDGKVNGTDFNILATNFNTGGDTWDQGDFTYDGKVNGSDFNLLAQNFNQGATQAADLAALQALEVAYGFTTSPIAVPEPASMALLTVGGLGILRRRRRGSN